MVSFHVKLPFFLASIHESKVKQLGEQLKAILNESFRGFPDLELDFFGNLVEVVQLVSDQPDQVSD